MAEITQKQIDDAIANCKWRQEVYGVSVCRGDCNICSRLIEDGRCNILKELFTDREDND